MPVGLDPRKPLAISRRRPGILYRLLTRVPKSAPTWMRGLVKELDVQIQKIWMALDNSLPGKHAVTHMGGSDSVSGSGTPVPVQVGVDGAAGNPRGGFAPFDHVHELDLSGLEIDPLPQESIEGNPKPPFKTLKQQTDWFNAQAVRQYAINPILKATWR